MSNPHGVYAYVHNIIIHNTCDIIRYNTFDTCACMRAHYARLSYVQQRLYISNGYKETDGIMTGNNATREARGRRRRHSLTENPSTPDGSPQVNGDAPVEQCEYDVSLFVRDYNNTMYNVHPP